MESIHLSIHPNDPLWIAVAFLFGLLVKLVGLPPLLGFLFAGFFLNFIGVEGGEFLSTTADVGITLLLFTIGLKLKLKSLARPEIWGVATIHMIITTGVIGVFIVGLASQNVSLFSGLSWPTALLIGFALSFSSTVFAIKILDELGATMSRHGNISIGLLVVQDIAAVIFLAISIGKIPSAWALGLILLLPMRYVLHKVLDYSGHGELLVLCGIVLALGGADIFELVGVKGDVGALVLGMCLANHPKSNEMSKALLSFKDLFLVGFFLSVGMTALPGMQEFLVAMIFIVLLPLKVILYYGLFNIFNLRASTSWRSSLNLATYSEFGLIVATVATAYGWLPNQWLAVFAIIFSMSFIFSAPLTSVRDKLYAKWRLTLKRFEREKRLAGEENLELKHVEAVVFGMGRVGTSVYDAIAPAFSDRIVGVEINQEKIPPHIMRGRKVVNGDGTNLDFWSRAPSLIEGLKLVILTMPTHQANLSAVRLLKMLGSTAQIAATSHYDDEANELKEMGVDLSFNVYAEAGTGFANNIKESLESLNR
ncbi:MAG: potassium transporter Kef [Cyclobacteriaceae bacterium]|nr:MAG: potassium transporter Kef [Cyclobacteriaceae bacterium]